MKDTIIAPEGYGTLKKDKEYFRIHSDGGRVLLISFDSKRNAHLECLDLDQFSKAASKRIVCKKTDEPKNLPPWLSSLEGVNLETSPAYKQLRKDGKTHLDVVEQRVLVIEEAVQHSSEIFFADNPDKELNRWARHAVPSQNETRFRNWFYTYIIFGFSKWALLPPMHKWGAWDRFAPEHEDKIFGRISEDGRRHGCAMTREIEAKIVKGFQRNAKVGDTWDEVYRKTLRKHFGCAAKRVEKKAEYFHPKGTPFPSINQFKYRCNKVLGKEEVSKALRGERKHRGEVATPEGRYSAELSNIFEKAYTDAYASKEHPRSYFGQNDPLPKLYTVNIYCGSSGYDGGVGFTLGSERDHAYLAALFCMAIPKSKFGEIMGIEIKDSDWPGHGIPSAWISDRGPGASGRLVASLRELGANPGMTPSYQPQSNSTAESRHPRAAKVEGAPTYKISSLTPIRMAQREVFRAITSNRTSSALGRATPETVAAGVQTSLDLYMFLDERLRNDSQQIPFDEAVRLFLQPAKLLVKEGRLFFKGINFDSAAFRRTTMWTKLLESESLDGYILEISVRKVWVEADGKIVELDAQLPLRGDRDQLLLSLPELSHYQKALSASDYTIRQQRGPENALAEQEFFNQTNARWNEGRSRRGRANTKTATASAEVAATRGTQ